MTDIFLSVVELAVVSTLITIILLLFEKPVLKRFSPELYYFAWLILAIRMLLPISLPKIEAPVSVTIPDRTVTVSYSAPEEIGYFDSTPDRVENTPAPDVIIPDDAFVYYPLETPEKNSDSNVLTSQIIANIWLIGVGAVALYYILQYAFFRIRLNKRVPVYDSSILSIFEDVCGEMNVKNASLCYWSEAKGPMLAGYIRPIIVLPQNSDLDEQTLKFIFTHELSHYRRRDLWYKLLMSAVTVLYWFDPFAWIMRKFSYKSVELACDSDVVKNKPIEYRGLYSKAILSGVALKHCASQGYTTYFANDKCLLKERFSFILDTSAKRVGITVLSLVIIASVVISSVVACDFNEPEKPEEIKNEGLIEEPDEIPEASIDAIIEPSPLTAFSIVCDADWNYSIAGIFENGNVADLFGFGEESVLDIDIDNGRLYVLLSDEIGYIDLAADKCEYTHLFYSDTHDGYNSFYRFAVHKGYIYLLYGVYDVGNVAIDRIPVTAKSMNEVERYQACMPMDDIFIDKENDLLYYYDVETDEASSEEISYVYSRDINTDEIACVFSHKRGFSSLTWAMCFPKSNNKYIFHTTSNSTAENQLWCLELPACKSIMICPEGVKSYTVSGEYVYYVDINGVFSVFDLENQTKSVLSTSDLFKDNDITLEPFGTERVLVWSVKFGKDWTVEASFYKIVDSSGNISESDKYRSSSEPVYITEPITSSGPSEMMIEDKPISFTEKRFTELFENIASFIGKCIFDGNSMTDEDKFFLAYFFGECDGSNAEYGDTYPLSYVTDMLSNHISENYASSFEPKNVSFYNSETMTFQFPSDFEKLFLSKTEQVGSDGILNVYKYSSDGNNLERIYIASLSAYSTGIGEMSWKINSYFEKLPESSSDIDSVGAKYFDIAVAGYGDTYKDYEYVSYFPLSNNAVVVGCYNNDYIAFDLFFSENGVGIISAELVDAQPYINSAPVEEPVPEEELNLNDIDEFEKYIIQALKDGDHELLNLLMGKQTYSSLTADPTV